MRCRTLLKVFVFMVASSIACAGEVKTPVLSWETFSQKVLAYYPKLKAAHSDIDMALAQQMQAKAGFWPSLDLSAGYKVSDDPVSVFGMLLRQERFTSSDFDLKRLNSPDRHQDLSAGIHVEWPLFDAMQTIHRVRGARGVLKASQADEAFTRMEAILIAQDAYLNAMTLERLSAVIDGVQKNSDEDLQKAKDLKDKGLVLGVDYYAARVMSGDFTRVKNELAHERKAMRALLNILMGEPSDQDWVLPGMIKAEGAAAQDQQKLMETALVHRPDITSLEARLQASDAGLSGEKDKGLPSLGVFADAAHDTHKIVASGGTNYTVGVKAQMSLFDPARAGRVKAAQAQKDQLEHKIQLLKDSIRRDIAGEAARYAVFKDNMPVLKGMADDAQEAVLLMVPLYNEGRKSIADLLEVRRLYWQSAEGYHKALLGIWASQARLLFLTGRLNGDEMNRWVEGAGL